MQEGDLVYIPQAVTLFDGNSIFIDKTRKPVLGIFLRETPSGAKWQSGTYTIYTQGREAIIERKHVYPMGEQYEPR